MFIVRFTIGIPIHNIPSSVIGVIDVSVVVLPYLLPHSLTISVDIISVYLKVGMYQGSVLGTLLFVIVMYVVTSEARSGIPSQLLYADT